MGISPRWKLLLIKRVTFLCLNVALRNHHGNTTQSSCFLVKHKELYLLSKWNLSDVTHGPECFRADHLSPFQSDCHLLQSSVTQCMTPANLALQGVLVLIDKAWWRKGKTLLPFTSAQMLVLHETTCLCEVSEEWSLYRQHSHAYHRINNTLGGEWSRQMAPYLHSFIEITYHCLSYFLWYVSLFHFKRF